MSASMRADEMSKREGTVSSQRYGKALGMGVTHVEGWEGGRARLAGRTVRFKKLKGPAKWG